MLKTKSNILCDNYIKKYFRQDIHVCFIKIKPFSKYTTK